jgi:serine protease Do
MTTVLEELDRNMGDVVQNARRSLVHILNGGRGSGAGSIWHSDGLIITNAHVVRDGAPRVRLPNGETLAAKILAHDARLDVAALAVDAAGLPTVALGDSRVLRPGQWVTALGHPWGIAGAATGGVVIGTGSALPEVPQQDREWIAVSLHLRPGHSGGPLVDVQGRLIGINTMMVGLEVGLAVPVHVVKDFLHRELGRDGHRLAAVAR